MSNAITFTCWEKDKPIEIHLEPEALLFVVQPGNEITFKGIKIDGNFSWALRIDHKDRSVQLFPDSLGPYEIAIYENGVLLSVF